MQHSPKNVQLYDSLEGEIDEDNERIIRQEGDNIQKDQLFRSSTSSSSQSQSSASQDSRLNPDDIQDGSSQLYQYEQQIIGQLQKDRERSSQNRQNMNIGTNNQEDEYGRDTDQEGQEQQGMWEGFPYCDLAEIIKAQQQNGQSPEANELFNNNVSDGQNQQSDEIYEYLYRQNEDSQNSPQQVSIKGQNGNIKAYARFQEDREEQQDQLDEEGNELQHERVACQQDDDYDQLQQLQQIKSKQERTQSLKLEQKTAQTNKDYSYSVQTLSNANKNKKNNNNNNSSNNNNNSQPEPISYRNTREIIDNNNKSANSGRNDYVGDDDNKQNDGQNNTQQQMEDNQDENNNNNNNANNTYQQDSLESFRSKGTRRYVSKSTEQPPILNNEQDFIDDNYLYYFRNSQDEEESANLQQQQEIQQIDSQQQSQHNLHKQGSFTDQSRRSLEALKQAEKIKDLFSDSINKKELYRWVDGSSQAEATYLAQLLQLRDSGQISPNAFDFQALIQQHNNNLAHNQERIGGIDTQNSQEYQEQKDGQEEKQGDQQERDIKEVEDNNKNNIGILEEKQKNSGVIVKENDNGISKIQKEPSMEVLTPQQKNMLIIGDNQKIEKNNNNNTANQQNNINNIITKKQSSNYSSSGSSQSIKQKQPTIPGDAQVVIPKSDGNDDIKDVIVNVDNNQELIQNPVIAQHVERDLRQIRHSNNQEELERELQKEQEEDELILRTCSRSLRDILAANNINSSKKEDRIDDQINSGGVFSYGRSGNYNNNTNNINELMQRNNQYNQQNTYQSVITAGTNNNNNLFGRSMNLLQNRQERQAELDRRIQEQNQNNNYNKNDRMQELIEKEYINQGRHDREYLLLNDQGQGKIIDQQVYDNYDDEEKQMNVRYEHHYNNDDGEDNDNDNDEEDYYQDEEDDQAYMEQDDDEEYPLHHLYPPKISEEQILTPQNRQARNWRQEIVKGEDDQNDDDEDDEEGQIYPKSLGNGQYGIIGAQQNKKKKMTKKKKKSKKIGQIQSQKDQEEYLIRRRQQQLELQKQQQLVERQQYSREQQQQDQQDQNIFVNELHENHWQKHPHEDEDEDQLDDNINNNQYNNMQYDNSHQKEDDNVMFNYNSIEDYNSSNKNDQQLYQQQQMNHRNTLLEYSQSSAKNQQGLFESQISRQLYTDSKHTREEILEEEKEQQSTQEIQEQQQKQQQIQQYQQQSQDNNRQNNEVLIKQRLSLRGINDIKDQTQKNQLNSNGNGLSSNEQVQKPCRIKVDLFRNLTQPNNQQKDKSTVPGVAENTTTAIAPRINQNIYDYSNNTFGRQSNSIQSSYNNNHEKLPENQQQQQQQQQQSNLNDSHKVHKSHENNLALLYPEQVQNISELSKRLASKYLSERQTITTNNNNHGSQNNNNNSSDKKIQGGLQQYQQQQQELLSQDFIDEIERIERAEYRAEVEQLKNSTRQQQLQLSSEKNPNDHSNPNNCPSSLLNRLDYQQEQTQKRQEQLYSQQTNDLQALDAKYSAITQVQTQTSQGITTRQILLSQLGDIKKSRQLSMGDIKNMNILQLNQHLLSTVSKRQKKQRDSKNYQSQSVQSYQSKSLSENIVNQNNSKINIRDNGGQKNQQDKDTQGNVGIIQKDADINNNSNDKRSIKNYNNNSRLSYPAMNSNINVIPNSLNNSSLSLSQGYQLNKQYQSTNSLISQPYSNDITKQPSQTLHPPKDNQSHTTANALSYPGQLIQFSLANSNTPTKINNIYKNNNNNISSNNPLMLQSNSIELSPLKNDLNSLMRPSQQIITPFNLDQQERQCLQLIAQQNVTAAQALLVLLENHINTTYPPKNTHRTFMYYLNARIEQLLSHNQSALTFCERGLSEIAKDQLYFDATLFKYAFTLRQMAQKEAESLQKLPQQLQHLRSMAEMIEFGLENKDRVDFHVAEISGQYAGKYLVEIYKTLGKIARTMNDHRACSQYLIKAQQRLNTDMDFEISKQLIEALIACDQKGEAILELKSQLSAISNSHNTSIPTDYLDNLKLNSLDILSNLYYEIGDFSSSLSTLEQTYNLKARIYGITDQRTSLCQFLIAQVHMKLQNTKQASKLFINAIHLLDKSLGEQNIYSANGLLSLAEITKNEGSSINNNSNNSNNNYSESMRYYEQARKRYKLLCGEDSFVCLVIILNELYLACKIASANTTHGQNYSSNHIQSLFHEIIYLTAHSSSNKTSADAINILNEAANILRNHSFLPQALEAYIQAKSLSNRQSLSQTGVSQDITNQNQDLLITMNIASTYELMGILDKAISHFEESLEITSNIQNSSAYTIKIHSCLGRIYKALWKNSEAVYHFKQALSIISNREGYVEEKMELRQEILRCQKSR